MWSFICMAESVFHKIQYSIWEKCPDLILIRGKLVLKGYCLWFFCWCHLFVVKCTLKHRKEKKRKIWRHDNTVQNRAIFAVLCVQFVSHLHWLAMTVCFHYAYRIIYIYIFIYQNSTSTSPWWDFKISRFFTCEKCLKSSVKACLQDQFRQTWHAHIDTGSKLFKNEIEFENYFNILDDRDIFTFCRFRLLPPDLLLHLYMCLSVFK
jgi:hypothetical protein